MIFPASSPEAIEPVDRVMYNNGMKVYPILFFLLAPFTLSLSAQNGADISSPGAGSEPEWIGGETVGSLLTLNDFDIPQPAGMPLMDHFFTGDKPERGYAVGIALFAAGVGTLGGSFYHTLDSMEKDPGGTGVGNGLITAGFSLAGIGISSLVMDFFRERIKARASEE